MSNNPSVFQTEQLLALAVQLRCTACEILTQNVTFPGTLPDGVKRWLLEPSPSSFYSLF